MGQKKTFPPPSMIWNSHAVILSQLLRKLAKVKLGVGWGSGPHIPGEVFADTVAHQTSQQRYVTWEYRSLTHLGMEVASSLKMYHLGKNEKLPFGEVNNFVKKKEENLSLL